MIPISLSVKWHTNVDLGHSVDYGINNKLCSLKCVMVDDVVRAVQTPGAHFDICSM